MTQKKQQLGQFFTIGDTWLKPQIREFIRSSGCTVAYDPFAGNGDLLRLSTEYGITQTRGLDIDDTLPWEHNDSLVAIPPLDNAVIITNPPYLSNYSASRKKVYDNVAAYFTASRYDDLYLIALDAMLKAQDFVVAIVPETFINSPFTAKNRLALITVLEDNPFEDTDTPVCVVCFDGREKAFSEIAVYKNATPIGDLATLEGMRLKPSKDVAIRFNVLDTWLGLRAVDTTDPSNRIAFDFKDNFDYNWEKGIKISSRLLTTIAIDVPEQKQQPFIDECNRLLTDLRRRSHDFVLSPFKGNMKNGVRRRRLDFMTARAIMEQAYKTVCGGMRMLSNVKYLEFATRHTEPLIDPHYYHAVNRTVSPATAAETNALITAHEHVVAHITEIGQLANTSLLGFNAPEVLRLLDCIIAELKTPGMNYSPFCQYFNVHNMNYSLFNRKTHDEKREILRVIIEPYLRDRHPLYLAHGYSPIVMQVMCDNYSHKRKGSYGANKIAVTLSALGITDLAKEAAPDFNKDAFYLLADKTGKKLFRQFAVQHRISLSDQNRETEKFPDALIKIGAQYFIVEQKNMKEDGGGQDKQAREITDFIFREPEFDGLHYVTYIDGAYFDGLNGEAHAKKLTQYRDIQHALTTYPANYFVNQAAFEKLMQDCLAEM